jgi:5-methylthioribose kinase
LIGTKLYDEILYLSTFILNLKLNLTNNCIGLLHGDLVPHNFLQVDTNCFIIDLDNFSQGPISYEYSVLGQHILNKNEWNANVLLKKEPFKQFRNDKFFWRCMLFPNDLLREWEHFSKAPKTFFETELVEQLIHYTTRSIKERNEFVEYGKNMVI